MRHQRGTSGPCSAKSIFIKNGKCRSDDGAWKAAGITPGDLSCVAATRLREPSGELTAGQKSAEGIVAAKTGRRPERLEWLVGIESHGLKAAEKSGTTGHPIRRHQ